MEECRVEEGWEVEGFRLEGGEESRHREEDKQVDG